MERLQQKRQQRGKSINVMGLFGAIGLGVAFVITLCQSVNAQMVNPVLVHPQINQGLVSGNGINIGTLSSPCTTSAAQFSCCNDTVTFNTAFSDTNFNVLCDCGGGGTGAPIMLQATPQNATSAIVTTCTLQASAAKCGSYFCLGIHN